MQFRPAILVALLVTVTVLAGCTSGGTNPTTSAPADNAVVMKSFKFVPEEITVNVGEEVTWRNDDGAPHDVTPMGNTTSWSPGGKAGMTKGETFSKSFDTAGTYEYYCQEHGTSMSGKVIVTA